jgi:hypothetical protein
MVQKAKDANIIGIVVGTLGVGNPHVVLIIN